MWLLLEFPVNRKKCSPLSSWRKHVGLLETSAKRAFTSSSMYRYSPTHRSTRMWVDSVWTPISQEPVKWVMAYPCEGTSPEGSPWIWGCRKVLGKFAKGCMTGTYLQDVSMCSMAVQAWRRPISLLSEKWLPRGRLRLFTCYSPVVFNFIREACTVFMTKKHQ